MLEAKVDGRHRLQHDARAAGLKSGRHRDEAGGLSGRPLFERSTVVLARMRRLLGPDLALIGVGGVDSAETALEKIRAGADLVQLYTGMIYQGPSLPAASCAALPTFAAARRLRASASLRDSSVDRWADRPID